VKELASSDSFLIAVVMEIGAMLRTQFGCVADVEPSSALEMTGRTNTTGMVGITGMTTILEITML
jgi:hypothetical protein